MKLEEMFDMLQNISESSTIEDAKSSAELFNVEISKMFGDDFVVNARVAKILGDTLVYDFYDKHAKVTRHNSPVNINLLMNLPKEDNKNFVFSITPTTISYQLKNKGVKFRKITGTSPMDVSKKLISWFSKNKNLILSTFNEHVKKG